jgi:hypothetical protein
MFRSLSAFVFAAALCVSPFVGSTQAQTPPGQPPAQQQQQQQYQPITKQSLPQMLQQAGFQPQAKPEINGIPAWAFTLPQSNKVIVVTPQKAVGDSLSGMTFSCSVSMNVGSPLSPQQLQAFNAKLAPYFLMQFPQNNEIRVFATYNYNDTNPGELQSWVNGLVAKSNEAQQLLFPVTPNDPFFSPPVTPTPAPVNPVPATPPAPVNPFPATTPVDVPGIPTTPIANVPVPVQIPSVANTTWKGTENLQGFGQISFQFMPNGKALMIDAKNTVPGSYVQAGDQVTIQLGQYATYKGNINGNLITGQGSSNGQVWGFSVNKSN